MGVRIFAANWKWIRVAGCCSASPWDLELDEPLVQWNSLLLSSWRHLLQREFIRRGMRTDPKPLELPEGGLEPKQLYYSTTLGPANLNCIWKSTMKISFEFSRQIEILFNIAKSPQRSLRSLQLKGQKSNFSLLGQTTWICITNLSNIWLFAPKSDREGLQ